MLGLRLRQCGLFVLNRPQPLLERAVGRIQCQQLQAAQFGHIALRLQDLALDAGALIGHSLLLGCGPARPLWPHRLQPAPAC
jgi:hypothetical protein